MTKVRTGLSSFDGGWDMGFHSHDDYEISVVLDGAGVFECAQITTTLTKGSAVLIASGHPHRYAAVGPIRFAVIQVGGVTSEWLENFDTLLAKSPFRVVRLPTYALPLYESVFRDWLRVVSTKQTNHSDPLVQAWLTLCLLLVKDQATSRAIPVTMETVADYIQENMHRSLDLDELASAMGMALSTFRRAFSQVYGLSPKQHHQQCRLAEAKWLLRSTPKTMSDIATAVGFASLHGFSAFFHRAEGLSPTKWRQAQNLDRPSGE